MLNPRQKEFAKFYVRYRVGATAARKAGYSHKSARQNAHNLLQQKEVRDYIEELEKQEIEAVNVNANEVIQQYKNLAYSDVNDYYEYYYELKVYSTSTVLEDDIRQWLMCNVGYMISLEGFERLSIEHQAYYEMKQRIKPFDLLTKNQRAAIQGITYDKFGNPVLKLAGKETSLNALANFSGVLNKEDDSKTQTISSTMEIIFV